MNITITDSAQEYLASLLEKQDVEGIAVRILFSSQVRLMLKRVLLTVVQTK